MTHKVHLVLVLVGTLGACHKPPALDAAHLPPELHGLMPGVSDLAAVSGALPGAEVKKDKRLGGEGRVELSEKPAIRAHVEAEKLNVWLVDLDGAPRVARVTTQVQDACKGALAALGGRAESGTCQTTNRKFEHDVHELCASTPDGAHKISIECEERSGELRMTLDVAHTDQGISELMAP
jgi:hypothetical protein